MEACLRRQSRPFKRRRALLADSTGHQTESTKIKYSLLPDSLFSRFLAIFCTPAYAPSHSAQQSPIKLSAKPSPVSATTSQPHLFDSNSESCPTTCSTGSSLLTWLTTASTWMSIFNQYIDPALLSLPAPAAGQDIEPAAYGLRPSDAGQSG